MQLSNLLQSKEWEGFEKAQGNETFWIDDNLLVKNKLPKGRCYLFCPRGPRQLTVDFVKKAINIARRNSAIFVRFEPIFNFPRHAKRSGARQFSIFNKFLIFKTTNINPANTLVLDLTKTEDQLLSEMKQKTRYNINLAKKKGVEIEKTSDLEKAKLFFEIMKQTAKRDKFGAHSFNHYKKLLEVLGPKEVIKLYLAKFEGEYIAANIVSFFGNTASYLHGASSNKHRDIMAPYLLQWQAILDAKNQGLKYYDFWGIAPDDSPRHKWAGVTRFKKGFGGTQLNYPGTYDLVISRGWYFFYKTFRILNRWLQKIFNF